jgi:hypothetical protein
LSGGDEAALEAVAAGIRAKGGEVDYFVADSTDENAVRFLRENSASTPEPGTTSSERAAAMRCNLPDVAPGVLHRGPPVAIWHIDGFLDCKSVCLERALVGLVGVLHIDIEEGRPRFAHTASVADHDQRIPDPHFSGGTSAHFAPGAEDQFEDANEAINVLREQPWDDGWPAIKPNARSSRT